MMMLIRTISVSRMKYIFSLVKNSVANFDIDDDDDDSDGDNDDDDDDGDDEC